MPLIYDIGVNWGEDSEFYLKKGFDVVGIEANPDLCANLQKKFSREIEEGRYTMLNIGISDNIGLQKFYVNLECDHWSSFDEAMGCRNGTKFLERDVQCSTISAILDEFGCPYYLKIDVEGVDRKIIAELHNVRYRPQFISVEEYGLVTIEELHGLGYDKFSLCPQQDKSWCIDQNKTREGLPFDWSFDHRCSGAFGRDVDNWLTFEEAKKLYLELVRDHQGRWLPEEGEFFDIHATKDVQ